MSAENIVYLVQAEAHGGTKTARTRTYPVSGDDDYYCQGDDQGDEVEPTAREPEELFPSAEEPPSERGEPPPTVEPSLKPDAPSSDTSRPKLPREHKGFISPFDSMGSASRHRQAVTQRRRKSKSFEVMEGIEEGEEGEERAPEKMRSRVLESGLCVE